MPIKPSSNEESVDLIGLKSPDAFRSISEVAGILQVPQHVLRFWEGKFSQLKPVKRRGGRRYYRISDIELLCGVHKLLYDDRYTIEGVQKVFSQHGARFVANIGRNAFSRSGDLLSDEAGEIEENSKEELLLPQETQEWKQSSLPSLTEQGKMESGDFEITEDDLDRVFEALDDLDEISAAMRSEFKVNPVVESGKVTSQEFTAQGEREKK